VDRNGSYAVPVRSSKCHVRGLCIVCSLECSMYIWSTFLNDVKNWHSGNTYHAAPLLLASLREEPVAWCGQISSRHTGRIIPAEGNPYYVQQCLCLFTIYHLPSCLPIIECYIMVEYHLPTSPSSPSTVLCSLHGAPPCAEESRASSM
jgi:hypothetical protein